VKISRLYCVNATNLQVPCQERQEKNAYQPKGAQTTSTFSNYVPSTEITTHRKLYPHLGCIQIYVFEGPHKLHI